MARQGKEQTLAATVYTVCSLRKCVGLFLALSLNGSRWGRSAPPIRGQQLAGAGAGCRGQQLAGLGPIEVVAERNWAWAHRRWTTTTTMAIRRASSKCGFRAWNIKLASS